MSKKWEKRFLSKIVRSDNLDDCWEWDGWKDKNGRGYLKIGSMKDGTRRNEGASRLSYALFLGDPGKLHVLHSCDNPGCVNPHHLFTGTHEDNMKDMAKKLRSGRAKLTPEDIVVIRKRWNAGESQYSIAKDFPVSKSTIWRAATGHDWQHIKKGLDV